MEYRYSHGILLGMKKIRIMDTCHNVNDHQNIILNERNQIQKQATYHTVHLYLMSRKRTSLETRLAALA